jgi:hypothetical protein
MSANSDQFRKRARQCRELARDARDEQSRQTLSSMAADLEAEADMLDAEEAPKQAGEG